MNSGRLQMGSCKTQKVAKPEGTVPAMNSMYSIMQSPKVKIETKVGEA